MNARLLILLFFFPVRMTAQPNPYTPHRHDILINEIMADPSPQVSLPNAEFIELKNTSGKDIDLTGWKLSTSTSSSGAFPTFLLKTDSFLIICSSSNAVQLSL